MTTDDVVRAVQRERGRLIAAVDAAGPGAASAPVTEQGWTAKEVLAHLIH